MGYSFNGLTRRITLTSGTTAFLTNDLYSRWKDWVRSGNAQWLPAFTSVGGESIGGGLTSGFYLFLQNGWSIIPDSIDHTLTVQGNLIRSPDDLSGEPVFQQVSASVLIIQQSSAVAIGYSTGGGTSLTAAQIWSYPTRTLTSGAVSPQTIRDAMKLAPSTGAAEEKSIDAILELAKDQAIIAARNTQK